MVRDFASACLVDAPLLTLFWRVHRQKDEEHRIRKEEKEASKRLKKDRERRERESRNPGPYGAYTNPMNDLERRMDGVDLGHSRGTSVGEYNSKRMTCRCPHLLSHRSTVRVAISGPDRPAIAQHGCHESRVSTCPSWISAEP
jgi:hypothetical protein